MAKNYICPDVEVLNVSIEKGFAATEGTGGTTGGGGWGAPLRDIDEY